MMAEYRIPMAGKPHVMTDGRLIETTEKGITHLTYEGTPYAMMKLKKKYTRGMKFKGVR